MHEAVAEVIELRSIVEVRAAGLAAERANEENLHVFRATAHHLIGSLFILCPVLEISHEIGVSSQPQPSGMTHTIAKHSRIVQTIRAGDAPAARQAMLDPLDWSAGRETPRPVPG
jgi:DNA-binding FadR family transcriptional regulator